MTSPRPSRGARCVFLLAAILTTTVSAQPSDVLFVNAVAPGGGNGRSWASAFRDLQSALTAAREDGGFREIWIARGTYIPGPTANPMRSFELVEGVTLIGGFAGYERSPMERPPTDALTVLSGDVRGNDDSGLSDRLNDNFARVVYASGINAGLRNLTITGGFGAYGAGVTVDSGRLCMVECRVVRNFGRVGSNPVERVGGAGLAVSGAGTLEMTRCLIADNIAGDASTGIGTGANGGDGGGIVCEDGTLVMHACIIAGNRAGNAGTVTCGAGFPHPGMPAGDGGGVAVRRGTALLTNCIFTRNAAGAAYEGRCCTIGCGGERPGGLGAAVFAEHSSPISLLHCTIAWNTVNQDVPDAAIWADVSSPVMIENSIVWGHSGGQPTAQLAAPQDQVVSHSCVQGWTPALGGTAVIAADPRLEWTRGADGAAGTPDDTLVPGSHSPCIDRALPVPGVPTDGAGLPRWMDDLSVVGSGPDMGAHEAWACVIDGDGDGVCDARQIIDGTLSDCNADGAPDQLTSAPPPLPGSVLHGTGVSLAVDEGWLIAGSPESRRVLIYQRIGSGWVFSAALGPPDSPPGDGFGAAVALSGPFALIGAPSDAAGGTNAGAIHVYERQSDGAWALAQTLRDVPPRPGARLGAALAASAGDALIGSPGETAGATGGSVLAVSWTPSGWQVGQRIVPSGTPAGAEFGASVAMTRSAFGPVAAVGSPGREGGSVHVLRLTSGGWIFSGRHDHPTAGARLGAAVSIDGDVAAAGAPGAGECFVLTRQGASWPVRDVLRGPDGPGGFGASAAVRSGLIAVGAPAGATGGTLVYQPAGTAWRPRDMVEAGAAGLGRSLAMGGNALAIGANPGVHATLLHAPDCNGNGLPDTCDILSDPSIDTDADGVPDSCFIACAACAADFDSNGGVDGADVEAFFRAWEDARPCADTDANGGIDGGDVEAFFVRWEAGSC